MRYNFLLGVSIVVLVACFFHADIAKAIEDHYLAYKTELAIKHFREDDPGVFKKAVQMLTAAKLFKRSSEVEVKAGIFVLDQATGSNLYPQVCDLGIEKVRPILAKSVGLYEGMDYLAIGQEIERAMYDPIFAVAAGQDHQIYSNVMEYLDSQAENAAAKRRVDLYLGR